MQNPLPLPALLLAGGASTRMGGPDKAFLTLPDGQTLLARQISALRQAGATEILLSGRPGADYSVTGLPVLLDDTPGLGPLSGLVAALRRLLPGQRLLVLAVDLPAITPAYLARLLAHPGPGGIVPLHPADGFFEPLAALLPAALLPLAEAALRSGALSLQPLVRQAIAAGLLQPLPILPAQLPLFHNCNTPADLAALL